MGLSKILIIPALRITSYSQRRLSQYKLAVRCSLAGQWEQAKAVLRDHLLCTEVYHYGDIPLILGAENTFIAGAYYKDYVRQDIPAFSRYPSLHKTPRGTPIGVRQIKNVINHVDAVLVSVRSGEVGLQVRQLARQHGKFVAILDYFDHLQAYENPSLENLTYGLKPSQDYDIFFKHDLPLGCASEKLYPLAPMPVRQESYPAKTLGMDQRDISVFFSGQNRPGVLRGDRVQVAKILDQYFPAAAVVTPVKMQNRSLAHYWDLLSRSKVAYSPSGKVWDSTRHCEVAMFGCVPLIPIPDCETVHKLVRDGENALGYRTKRLPDGSYVAQDVEKIGERVKTVLQDPRQLSALAKAWQEEILGYHTTRARAQYLLDTINRSMKT